MEYTNFGQIKIYNNLFKDIKIEENVQNDPIECINKKLNYAIINVKYQP